MEVDKNLLDERDQKAKQYGYQCADRLNTEQGYSVWQAFEHSLKVDRYFARNLQPVCEISYASADSNEFPSTLYGIKEISPPSCLDIHITLWLRGIRRMLSFGLTKVGVKNGNYIVLSKNIWIQ